MKSTRGQVLPLFALLLIALFGLSALAIDVSGAYAARQFYRTAADAASLAGAQDLQGGSRQPSVGDYSTARADALTSVARQLEPTSVPFVQPSGGGCSTNPIANCAIPNTQYVVRITSPVAANGCVTCDPAHSVAVTVANPDFQLSFAHVFGFGKWNVASTSVAGLQFPASYALVTLQPPDINNHGTLDQNIDKDIIVNSTGTILNVVQGDVGTNTSAHTTNSGEIRLADGFYIDHIDDLSALTPNPNWSQPDGVHPVGRYIGPSPYIQDPNYYFAQFTTAPTWTTQTLGAVPTCTGQAGFPTDAPTLAFLTKGGTVTPTCYRAGIYSDNQVFKVDPGAVAYLLPGAYRFTHGMTQNGTLAGGMINSQPGVVLSFPRLEKLSPNSAVDFALNTGAETCSSDGCRATAAVDFATPPQQVKTSQGLILTIEVDRDPACFAGTNPQLCPGNVNQNTTISLGGSGKLRIAGVIYGPSDNMSINASAQTGTVGQIIAYTVKYAGGATLNQSYPGPLRPGIMRLDAACTAPGTRCVP